MSSRLIYKNHSQILSQCKSRASLIFNPRHVSCSIIQKRLGQVCRSILWQSSLSLSDTVTPMTSEQKLPICVSTNYSSGRCFLIGFFRSQSLNMRPRACFLSSPRQHSPPCVIRLATLDGTWFTAETADFSHYYLDLQFDAISRKSSHESTDWLLWMCYHRAHKSEQSFV